MKVSGLQRVFAGLLASALALWLAGCGGGGGTPGPPPGPPILSITTTTVPDGVTGVAYNQTLTATGGTGTRTWSETTAFFDDSTGAGAAGGPCQGLTLSFTAGTISGTPVNPGSCGPFTIRVVDSGSPQQTDTQDLTIRIADPLVITTTVLPNGTQGVAYNQTIMTSGGIAPVTFSFSGVPPGIGQNPNTGALIGAPFAGGSFNIGVQVRDSSNPQQLATRNYPVLILQVTTFSIPPAIENVAYNTGPLTVTGQVNPVMWGATNLPPSGNLSIDPVTGAISGTPTAVDVGMHNLTVMATDSDSPPRTDSQLVTLNIAATLAITTTALPDAMTGTFYLQFVMATGGLGPYTWSEPTAFFGSMGAGAPGTPCEGLDLSLLTSNISLAVDGTPVNLGNCGPFTVQVADTSGQSDAQDLSIVVNPGPLVITTTSLPAATVGAPYNATIQATGGTPGYTWSEPTALFNDATGAGLAGACVGLTLDVGAPGLSTTISGTPVNSGTCGLFTVRITDNAAVFDEQDLSITVNAAPLGRNDCLTASGTCNGPTMLTTGGLATFNASISPFISPPPAGVPLANDTDYYQLSASATNVVTIEIFATRAPVNGRLDSVIEIVDGAGVRFNTCKDPGDDAPPSPVIPDSTPTLFDDQCINDDIDLGVITDSKLEFLVPGTMGTVNFFVRVLDWRGDARPDLLYQITIQGAN